MRDFAEAKSWRTRGLLRLLENVLDVGEDREKLIVYAALGKAARDQASYQAIIREMLKLEENETLVIQSGKPIGVLRTHELAPMVIMANCNMVGHWATAENFYQLERKNLICWGGLTAGDWQYIGSQGVIQGTYEIFSRIAERHFSHSLAGRTILTAGLGGMGGAQPLAGVLAGAAILTVEVDETRIDRRIEQGYLQCKETSLAGAMERISAAASEGKALSVGLLGNAAEVFPQVLKQGFHFDIVTDQTAAHDLLYGYIPLGMSVDDAIRMRERDPATLMAKSRDSIVLQVKAMLALLRGGAVVFDNGNLIRSQAYDGGVTDAFEIPVFTEAYIRPLFCRAIGPFRWVALSGKGEDIRKIDHYLLERFRGNAMLTNWIRLANEHVPFQGLPARIAWLGHLERSEVALQVNRMVAAGELAAPVAFTRDHLDAGAMTHPNIMTENLRDGSDAISDWPLINAMVHCASQADLVAIHSGGGGYSGYMTSAGVTIIADGSEAAAKRLSLSLDNDTSLGVLRYADAGYPEALAEAKDKGIKRVELGLEVS